MLSFGTRKTHVEEWSKYELEEEKLFALLESILEEEPDKAVARTVTDTAELDSQVGLEEEAFTLSILDEDDDSIQNKHRQLRAIQQVREELEEEAFALLETILDDDDALIDQDIVVYTHKKHQPQGIDPLEMKKLEDAAFVLLETVFEDDDEPIDEDLLFPAHTWNQVHIDLQGMEKESFVFLESTIQDNSDLNSKMEFMLRKIRLG